jgi:hypothetical protein
MPTTRGTVGLAGRGLEYDLLASSPHAEGCAEALSPEMSGVYTSTTATLVESAAPFSTTGIGFLVTVGQNGPLTFAFA